MILDKPKPDQTPNIVKAGNSKVVAMSPDKPPLASTLRSRKFIVIVCLLLATISTAAAILALSPPDKDATDQSDTSPTSNADISPTVQEVNDRIANGEPDEAQQLLTENPALKNSRDGKVLAASIVLNKGSYAEAIQQYQAIATEYGWTSNLADRVARGYVLLGDKQNAITYYNKAIELIDKENSPVKSAEKAAWKREIEALQ